MNNMIDVYRTTCLLPRKETSSRSVAMRALEDKGWMESESAFVAADGTPPKPLTATRATVNTLQAPTKDPFTLAVAATGSLFNY
jgi:hypothetical protein